MNSFWKVFTEVINQWLPHNQRRIANPEIPPSLLLSLLHFSVLSRLFKQSTGVTKHRYLTAWDENVLNDGDSNPRVILRFCISLLGPCTPPGPHCFLQFPLHSSLSPCPSHPRHSPLSLSRPSPLLSSRLRAFPSRWRGFYTSHVDPPNDMWT